MNFRTKSLRRVFFGSVFILEHDSVWRKLESVCSDWFQFLHTYQGCVKYCVPLNFTSAGSRMNRSRWHPPLACRGGSSRAAFCASGAHRQQHALHGSSQREFHISASLAARPCGIGELPPAPHWRAFCKINLYHLSLCVFPTHSRLSPVPSNIPPPPPVDSSTSFPFL